MPNFQYICDDQHIHTEFHATLAPPPEVVCSSGCQKPATRTLAGGAQVTEFEFGLGFSVEHYAAKPDRGAWMKKYDQKGW